jgi:hypothetical protein
MPAAVGSVFLLLLLNFVSLPGLCWVVGAECNRYCSGYYCGCLLLNAWCGDVSDCWNKDSKKNNCMQIILQNNFNFIQSYIHE